MSSPLTQIIVAALAEPEVRDALRVALGSTPPDELLPLEVAAKLVAKTPRALRAAGGRGDFEIVKIGRSPRVRRSALLAWATPVAVAKPVTNDAREDAAEAVRRAARKAAR